MYKMGNEETGSTQLSPKKMPRLSFRVILRNIEMFVPHRTMPMPSSGGHGSSVSDGADAKSGVNSSYVVAS